MLNTTTSVLLQIVTVVCGFILPRLFLTEYGSQVNGLVQSITQFLGVISLLELGIGQVIQSALYKPLAMKDTYNLNCVLTAGEKFFRRIAYILLVYVVVLIIAYPNVANEQFDWAYTATLIGAISISSFAQYYFGITDRLLLNADQRGYIQYTSQIVTLVLNTVAAVILIKSGASVQMVKLVSSLIFVARPMVVRLYVNKHYSVNRREKYDHEPIKQKWNGIAQHVSSFVLGGTDTLVLTLCSTLTNVSIYSIYFMIINGVHLLYDAAAAGIHAIVGDLWAKQQLDRLRRVYGCIETTLHFATVFLYSCTAILILPFITIYTDGITDANYMQPLFAILLIFAHGTQCLRTTYNMMILAGGHYKQTQKCHIIGALMNLGVSIVLVFPLGLLGVAIGTLVTMIYQTIWMAWYDSKNLLCWPLRSFVKQVVIDIITAILICLATSWIRLSAVNYLSWILMALIVAVIAAVITVLMALIFYRQRTVAVCQYILRRRR